MSKVIKESDIEKLPLEEQLAFYKKEFRYQHCELESCGNEVSHHWVQYDGSLYCADCFDWLIAKEKEEAQTKIDKYEKEIRELKETYDL